MAKKKERNYKRKWFKFYGQDWMTDIKMMTLAPLDRLCYITILCIASSSDIAGIITNYNENIILQLTHIYNDPLDDDNDWTRTVGVTKRLEALHAVTLVQDDTLQTLHIVNWKKRQDGLTSDDPERVRQRVAKYREKMAINGNRNNVVTSNGFVTTDKIREEKRRIEKNNHNLAAPPQMEDCVNLIFKIFYDLGNKGINFGNITQRKATEFLLANFGFEETKRLAKYACSVSGDKYAPFITNPSQSKAKFGQLTAHWNRSQQVSGKI